MGTKAYAKKQSTKYNRFSQIDGTHPYQDKAPGSFVLYQARYRPGGKVSFFNFNLAKEMGLIAQDHPHEMNADLEKKILETFSLMIINEFDIIHKTPIRKEWVKSNHYMATRYLQLQHPSKNGMTSGDGRSIWNGVVNYRGKTWDVSSCGTGATCLSPATAHNNKFYKSGDPSISYGCGYAEALDGVTAAIMSEVFHNNGIATERSLCVIEYNKSYSVNVRAAHNLLRPSHMFLHLKQKQYDRLKSVVDFYIDREQSNGNFPKFKTSKKSYEYLLEKMTDTFAKISAVFETEYIFCWLDWDGDNILMDGGIIDYGSVRQFGLYHHEYRYDDVERWSTTISEQKNKAKYTVKVFAQLVDYLISGERSPLSDFDKHQSQNHFDELYETYKVSFVLQKTGFTDEQIELLLENKNDLVIHYLQAFSYFESYKSSEGPIKIEDGVTHNAVFCMRDFLREYPEYLKNNYSLLDFEDLLNIFVSSYATAKDMEKSSYKDGQSKALQKSYMAMVEYISELEGRSPKKILSEMLKRCRPLNRYARITGDSILTITQEFLNLKNRKNFNEYTKILEKFILDQSSQSSFDLKSQNLKESDKRFISKVFKIIEDYREGI